MNENNEENELEWNIELSSSGSPEKREKNSENNLIDNLKRVQSSSSIRIPGLGLLK